MAYFTFTVGTTPIILFYEGCLRFTPVQRQEDDGTWKNTGIILGESKNFIEITTPGDYRVNELFNECCDQTSRIDTMDNTNDDAAVIVDWSMCMQDDVAGDGSNMVEFTRVFIKNVDAQTVDVQNHNTITGAEYIPVGTVTECKEPFCESFEVCEVVRPAGIPVTYICANTEIVGDDLGKIYIAEHNIDTGLSSVMWEAPQLTAPISSGNFDSNFINSLAFNNRTKIIYGLIRTQTYIGGAYDSSVTRLFSYDVSNDVFTDIAEVDIGFGPPPIISPISGGINPVDNRYYFGSVVPSAPGYDLGCIDLENLVIIGGKITPTEVTGFTFQSGTNRDLVFDQFGVMYYLTSPYVYRVEDVYDQAGTETLLSDLSVQWPGISADGALSLRDNSLYVYDASLSPGDAVFSVSKNTGTAIASYPGIQFPVGYEATIADAAEGDTLESIEKFTRVICFGDTVTETTWKKIGGVWQTYEPVGREVECCDALSAEYNTPDYEVISDGVRDYLSGEFHSLTFIIDGSGATLSVGGSGPRPLPNGSLTLEASRYLDEDLLLTVDAATTVYVAIIK